MALFACRFTWEEFLLSPRNRPLAGIASRLEAAGCEPDVLLEEDKFQRAAEKVGLSEADIRLARNTLPALQKRRTTRF